MNQILLWKRYNLHYPNKQGKRIDAYGFMQIWGFDVLSNKLASFFSLSGAGLLAEPCVWLAASSLPPTRRTLLFYLRMAPSSWTTNLNDWFRLDSLSFLRFHLLSGFLGPYPLPPPFLHHLLLLFLISFSFPPSLPQTLLSKQGFVDDFQFGTFTFVFYHIGSPSHIALSASRRSVYLHKITSGESHIPASLAVPPYPPTWLSEA